MKNINIFRVVGYMLIGVGAGIFFLSMPVKEPYLISRLLQSAVVLFWFGWAGIVLKNHFVGVEHEHK